jgi:hypothetical protein
LAAFFKGIGPLATPPRHPSARRAFARERFSPGATFALRRLAERAPCDAESLWANSSSGSSGTQNWRKAKTKIQALHYSDLQISKLGSLLIHRSDQMPAPSTGEARRATMGQRSRALRFLQTQLRVSCATLARAHARWSALRRSCRPGEPAYQRRSRLFVLSPVQDSARRPSLRRHEQTKPLFCFVFDASVVFRASLAFRGNGIAKQQKRAASAARGPEGE